MEMRKLGSGGLEVGALGLGCMNISHGYVRPEDIDEAEGIATIQRALDRGVTLLDTAEAYGPFTNEVVVGKAIRGRREQVVVATKFGIQGGMDGTPGNARKVAEESLKRLNVDVIDLFYLHRKDANVPIEESVGGMKDLVDQGKVRFLGLSEVGPETLRRANAVHPIAALQSEYLPVRTGGGGEDPAHPAGAGHRLRAVQPPGTRVSWPAPSPAPPSFPPATSARTFPGSRRRTPRPTPASWPWSGAWPPAAEPPRPRWPWPGSWPRARTSCPSPGPGAAAAWTRTWTPWPCA